MKSLLTTTLLFVASFSSQAFVLNSDIQFVAADTSAETNLCMVAAESGYKAANRVKSADLSLATTKCNGLSIQNFAKQYQPVATTTTVAPVTTVTTTTILAKTYNFVPANNSEESKLCTVAATEGFRAAIQSTELDANNLYCNGSKIKSFAKRYAKS